MPTTMICPQCQAKLKLAKLAPGKAVTCPKCRLRFTLSHAPAAASNSGRLWLVLVIAALGLSVGGVLWHQNRNSDPDSKIVENKPVSTPKDNDNSNLPAKIGPLAEKPASESPAVPKKVADDELPDLLKPIAQKPPPAVSTGTGNTKAAKLKPASYPRQREVDQAITRGVQFLRGQQKVNGEWVSIDEFNHSYQFRMACTALVALTLLECGVPAKDTPVQDAVREIRSWRNKYTATYDLSLAILFLDRLGDPEDRDIIRQLAFQLIAGQNAQGGWAYQNGRQLSSSERLQLDSFLRVRTPDNWLRRHPLARRALSDRPSGADIAKPAALPADLASLPVVLGRLNDPAAPMVGYDDNSNTQFALLGLWAARRHGVPVLNSFALAEERFRTTRLDLIGWPYTKNHLPLDPFHRPRYASMTCAGLLGLAVGYGTAWDALDAKAKDTIDSAALLRDDDVKEGFKALANHMLVPPQDFELIAVYFLWSLERVANLYGLAEIGDRNWYAWGADHLLKCQAKDGSWNSRMLAATPISDTCFALLFLRRHNPAADLSENLKLFMALPTK